jgi:hypothetical protein
MRRFLGLFVLLSALLTSCSFGPQRTDFNKLASAKVENPFFSIPPENLKDYQNGTWILLAESKTKNWFYDPYSLVEDSDGIVSFNTFVTERSYQDQLKPFNATSIGPYLQKIDCFGNHQWSEIFYAEQMPKQESYVNPLKPNQEWGWIKIKPKTSMAYIRARVCGRKFIDDQNVNYFLFQQGRMPYVKEQAEAAKTLATKVQTVKDESSVIEVPERSGPNTPIFYEVVNNEVKVIDAKKDIRQLKLASYNMDKDFSKRGDFIFQANCRSKTYSLAENGQRAKVESLSDSKDDIPNVAFNRACGDHGAYMQNGSKNK